MYVCKYCQSSKWRGGIGLPTFNDQVGISPQNVNTSRQVSREKFSDKAIMYWCNINLSLLAFKELYGYRSVIEVVWLKGFPSVCSFTVLVLKLSFQNQISLHINITILSFNSISVCIRYGIVLWLKKINMTNTRQLSFVEIKNHKSKWHTRTPTHGLAST